MHKAILIGAGDRGSIYAAASAASGLELGCIYDINRARAQALAEKLSDFCKPTIAESLEEALSTPGADIAFICIPAYFHADYSMEAINHGLNVLCEKPFDLDYKKVEALGSLAREKGKVLAVGHQYHNFKNLRSIKKIMDADLIGRPTVLRFVDVRERRPKLAMHDAKEGNCGPMLDMSCHFIDIMQWAFNSKPVKVTARRNTYAAGDPLYSHFAVQAPDTGILMVEYESGDIGIITVCWGLESGVQSYSPIDGFGPKGFIRGFELWDTNHTVVVNTPLGDLPIEFDTDETVMPEKTTLRYFLDAIDGKGNVQVSFEDAEAAFATSLAGLKSSESCQTVKLSDIRREKPKTTDYINIDLV